MLETFNNVCESETTQNYAHKTFYLGVIKIKQNFIDEST